METKDENLSKTVAGEATGIPPKTETEVVAKVAMTVEEPLKVETVTMEKAEFEKIKAQMQEMEKNLALRKEQDTVAEAILKAVERLEPKMKKVHEEIQTVEKSAKEREEEMKKQMEKMSVGELTQLMLKGAKAKED
jgi:hypothetical protein